MRNSTGLGSKFFENSKNLMFADFSGSDLNSLADFTDLSAPDSNYQWIKKDLAFLFVSETKISTFDAINSTPNLKYFGAANTLFNAGLEVPGLFFADYRNAPLTNIGKSAQTFSGSSSSNTSSFDLAKDAFFCKVPLTKDGTCDNPHQTCDSSTITYKYTDGPNSLISEMCCVVKKGESPSLPGIGAIDTIERDGKTQICASLSSDSSFFK